MASVLAQQKTWMCRLRSRAIAVVFQGPDRVTLALLEAVPMSA